jgi:hypothetical protein
MYSKAKILRNTHPALNQIAMANFLLLLLMATLYVSRNFKTPNPNSPHFLIHRRITAQSLICSTSSSALVPGASVCCYNTSVTFKQLEIYATANDMNSMNGCLTISWSCGSCVSNIGRVCESAYSYQCNVPQQEVYCSVCAYNSNMVFTEQVYLQVDAY